MLHVHAPSFTLLVLSVSLSLSLSVCLSVSLSLSLSRSYSLCLSLSLSLSVSLSVFLCLSFSLFMPMCYPRLQQASQGLVTIRELLGDEVLKLTITAQGTANEHFKDKNRLWVFEVVLNFFKRYANKFMTCKYPKPPWPITAWCVLAIRNMPT